MKTKNKIEAFGQARGFYFAFAVVTTILTIFCSHTLAQKVDPSVLDIGAPTIEITQVQRVSAIATIQSQIDRKGHDGGIVLSTKEKDKEKATKDRDMLLDAAKAGIDSLEGKVISPEMAPRFAEILLESAGKADKFESKSKICVALAKKVSVSYRIAAASLCGTLKLKK